MLKVVPKIYLLRPGLSATVDIESESLKGISVPIQAVYTGDKSKDGAAPASAPSEAPAAGAEDKQKSKLADKTVKQYVFVFENGAVKQVEVATGIQNDQFIIVKSGLKPGTEVVSGPYSAIQNRLKDGMKVEKTAKDQLFASPDKK
jgi:HlyD family secretion protein